MLEAGEFADWLSGIGRLSDEQVALALTELGSFSFHGVATTNLPNYLGWRRALEASTEPIDPQSLMLAAFGQGAYQQITP